MDKIVGQADSLAVVWQPVKEKETIHIRSLYQNE